MDLPHHTNYISPFIFISVYVFVDMHWVLNSTCSRTGVGCKFSQDLRKLPHPNKCNLYYECEPDDCVRLKRCPDDQEFRVFRQECQANVMCDQGNATITEKIVREITTHLFNFHLNFTSYLY